MKPSLFFCRGGVSCFNSVIGLSSVFPRRSNKTQPNSKNRIVLHIFWLNIKGFSYPFRAQKAKGRVQLLTM